MKNQKTIALFGATGSSGKEFLKLALEHNYKIKALVRNAKNVEIENSNLQLIHGDFTNKEAIKHVVENSDFIICMAGSLKSPVKDLMYDFIRILHPIMLQEKVFNLTYQAGALCYLPNTKKSLLTMFMRNTIGKITRMDVSLADHDKVLSYIATNMTPDGINTIVTLPGAAGLTPGPSHKELQIQKGVKFTSSKFKDVAKFTFMNFNNPSLYGKFIYIA